MKLYIVLALALALLHVEANEQYALRHRELFRSSPKGSKRDRKLTGGCGQSAGKAGRRRYDGCEDDYYVEEVVVDDYMAEPTGPQGCAPTPMAKPVPAPVDTIDAPSRAPGISPRKSPVTLPIKSPVSPPVVQDDDDETDDNDNNDDISNENIDLPGDDDDEQVDDDEVSPSNENMDRGGPGGQNVTVVPPMDDDETVSNDPIDVDRQGDDDERGIPGLPGLNDDDAEDHEISPSNDPPIV